MWKRDRIVLLAALLLLGAGGCSGTGSAAPSFFSVVLIPDTQQYVDVAPKTFWAQTRWVAGEKEALNITAAIHLGDMVQTDDMKEWMIADAAYDALDAASIPYSVVPGNHDIAIMHGGYPRDASRFNVYFGPDRFEKKPWYGGHYDVGSLDNGGGNENNYIFFEATGLEFMVVSLELGPRDEVIQWANDLIAAHPQRRVIIATHSYLCYDNTRVGSVEHEPGTDDCWAPKHYIGPNREGDKRGADGEEMWHTLVKRHSNVFMVVSGHVLKDGAGYLESTGIHGNRVHQILANYQIIGYGWLRVLRFVPSENKIYVEPDTPLRLGRYTDD